MHDHRRERKTESRRGQQRCSVGVLTRRVGIPRAALHLAACAKLSIRSLQSTLCAVLLSSVGSSRQRVCCAARVVQRVHPPPSYPTLLLTLLCTIIVRLPSNLNLNYCRRGHRR